MVHPQKKKVQKIITHHSAAFCDGLAEEHQRRLSNAQGHAGDGHYPEEDFCSPVAPGSSSLRVLIPAPLQI